MKKFLLSIAAMALMAAPTFAQELADNQQEVESEYYGDAEDGGRSMFFKNYDCVVTRNGGNTYTISNPFNSGLELVFSFDLSELDDNGWCPITYHESDNVYVNHDSQGFDDYIMQKGGTSWNIQAIDGSSVELSYIYFRAGSAWLNPQDNEDGDWYDYYAEMFVWAYGPAGWSNCHYMTFFFDETPEGTSSVAKVEVDEAAPAVYYNLQGQKVANPSNGLYILRQGKNVQKVMVK